MKTSTFVDHKLNFMQNISISIPWYYDFFKKISATYKLVSLSDNNGNSYGSKRKKKILGDFGDIGSELFHTDTTGPDELSDNQKFFWLRKEWVVANTKPKPTGFFAKIIESLYPTYQAEFTFKALIGNIEIIDDNKIEIWVYGEKYLTEISEFFKIIEIKEGMEINILLRQKNPLNMKIYK